MPRMLAPEVGALVEYGRNSFDTGPGEYRVSGWMREAVRLENLDVLDEILFESCQEIRGKRMQFCLRAEATHVALHGICGAIAPIEDVKVTGMVGWTEELLRWERERAARLGARHEMVF